MPFLHHLVQGSSVAGLHHALAQVLVAEHFCNF